MTSAPWLLHGSVLGVLLFAMAAGTLQGCTDSESEAPTGGTSHTGLAGAAGELGSGGSDAAGSGNDAAGSGNGGTAGGGTPEATAGVAGDSAGGAAGDSAGGAPPTGFTTWTYDEAKMGLYVPPEASGPLPVLMYLHGCHNDPVYPGYWIISAANEIEPCAVFLPTAPPATTPPYSDYPCADWGGTYDPALRPNMLNALAELDRLIEDYGFDTQRQYLYGESMGGEGVFRLLVDLPTRFAGAVAASGYTLDTGAGEMAQTPLWIFHGASDSISPVENDRAIYQSILDAGGTQVQYTEYPDLEHVPGIEQARAEPGLFDWLLALSRD